MMDADRLNKLIVACRIAIERAERDLGKLPPKQYLDLCADQFPAVPLCDLRTTLIAAKVGYP